MILNKLARDMFKEISVESLKQANNYDLERKYHKRLLTIFKDKLSEDEQIFLFKQILYQIHFRTIITDPDNIIQIHNIKLRTMTYFFLLTIVIMIVFAMIFKVNDGLNSIATFVTHVVKILSI